MKRILSFIFLLCAVCTASADDGNWHIYAAYHNATKVVQVKDLIYVLSDGNLYSYDPEDTSVTTYDKTTVLSDFDIFDIVACEKTGEVAIVYKNGNIDLLDADGNTFNLSELKTKIIPNKTINDAIVEGDMLYISINSGIVCVNLRQRAFADYYDLGVEVRSTALYEGRIMALTPSGIYTGDTATNLLDPSNWQNVGTNLTYYQKIRNMGGTLYIKWVGGLAYIRDLENFRTSQVFADRVTNDIWTDNGKLYAQTSTNHFYEVSSPTEYVAYDNEEGILSSCYSNSTYWCACGEKGLQGLSLNDGTIAPKVASVIPDGPIRDYAYKLNMIGDRLLVAGGVFNYSGEMQRRATVMKYENGQWTTFDESPYDTFGDLFYRNASDVVQDPADPEHHFVGTVRSGIYEFQDYKYVDHFTYDNSPITSILPTYETRGQYVRTTGLAFDAQRNLWFCNTECDTVIRIFKADRTWTSYYVPEIKGFPTFDHIVFDQRGWAWINSRRSGGNGVKAGFLIVNTNNNPGNPSGFSHKFVNQFYNQDGNIYAPVLMTCFCFDLNGALWLGYDKGLFMVPDPVALYNSTEREPVFQQVKVTRKDDPTLADYLLSEVPIKCITIDGGNRKWIGTSGQGVYLISPDGQETIEHFTAANSPLTSDDVYDIKVNGKNGEVFIATANGLCSFIGEATDPVSKFDKDLVKVYPNPVGPEYDGKIVIRGLMTNTNVKIVNAAGRLVHEGTSVGGTYSWNGRLASGKRCASGVYYILGTNESGDEGVVGKFVII